MAEIHIEKKRRPVWPWIVGLLVLVGVVWIILKATDRDKKVAYEEDYVQEEVIRPGTPKDKEENEGAGTAMTSPNDSTNQYRKMEDFVSYVNEIEFKEGMGVDHQVTAKALAKLSDAIQEISPDDESTVNELRQTADDIMQDPQSLKHADKIKEVAVSTAETLKEVQQEEFPEMKTQVKEVEKAAKSIKGKQDLVNQKEAVQEFFEKTASTINSMEKEEQPS